MAKRISLLLLMTAMSVTFSLAQIQGKVEGEVADEKGVPIEKAEVTIVSQKSAAIHFDMVTDAQGKFFQVGLQPGYFVVNVKKEGFGPEAREFKIGIGEVTRIKVVLKSVADLNQKALSAADKLFLKGNNLYAAGKFQEAAAVYEEAVANNASHFGYRLNLGLSYKKLNRLEDALAAFRKAVELEPESFSANKELGEALARTGDPAAARPYYEKASALNPDDPDVHYNLGLCLNAGGDAQGALSHYEAAVRIKPDFAEPYYEMGTVLIGQNRVPDAVAALQKFLELAPDHEKAAVAKQLLDYLKK